ncbi:MAG: sensor histidine kinase KdpD [Chthoniobacter sp.]|nr:sensor histidine kinase KdpD [Chthoniobacter sp.]
MRNDEFVPDENRPNPDALLAAIHADESKARRGRLKVFFGMCPGVGKTYAMLEAAQRKVKEGVEVVIGVVETHGRAETLAMLEGMPIVPRAKIEHRGAVLEEMDFEAILIWHPRLVIVDELAHTNAPGSRHPKRYQDVLELLDAGIDVYTTLNVQHVESRTDAVRQFTGVIVRETVPDSMLDVADEIELVDLTPERLRQRLSEGKVYLGDRAVAAGENFFREGNLTALREMALRLTAEHVDRSLRAMQPTAKSDPWRSGDRLAVAVSASPHSAELVRWTRRYAASLEAPWIAVAVESPESLGPEDEKRRTANLALARQLGAEVVLTSGAHIGEALLLAAQEHAVTQLVMGKPDGPPWRWLLNRRSPIPWLIQHSGRIDVQLVRTEAKGDRPLVPARDRPQMYFREFGIALGIAAGATIFCQLVQGLIGYWSVALVYLLTVTLAAATLRRGPTLLLAALSALLWNFLFIPPLYTFYISKPHDVMMFAMFFIVAIVIGQLTSRLRERERLEHRREQRANALYQLTRRLAAVTSRDAAVKEVLAQIQKNFGLNAAALLRDDSGAFAGNAHPASTWKLSTKEEGVAAWAFQNKRAAGRDTDTLPDGEGLHLPLIVADRVEGVLGVELGAADSLVPEQRELLEAFASQLAIVAEKERLAHVQRRAQVVAESERLQKTLFDSVSHELKTPIAAIRAALDQPEVNRDEIQRANDRLRRTVDHLLDATRIESGMLKPVIEWCDAGELAREACELTGVGERVQMDIAPDLPPLRADHGLIAQALATLVDNATIYGSASEPALLTVRRNGDLIRFEVADRGAGFTDGTEEKIFEKFFRLPGSPAGGVGLGLSIARHLVEAHRGTLTAENRPAGGARFILQLPIGGELKLPA